MARTEKKTKIKGLPPKILLTQRDAATGSFPLVVHGSSEGLPSLAPFSDQNTMIMTSSNIYYGLGVSTASTYIPEMLNLTTSLTGSGRVAAGISDEFITVKKYQASTSFGPFRDHGQQAADQKGLSDSFWNTGSNIESFKGALSSKNKIEIDFTPLAVSSLTGSRGGQTSSYMGYFNFAKKIWQPVRPGGITTGRLDPGGVCSASISPAFGEGYRQAIWGFSACHNLHYGSSEGTLWASLPARARPISTFGFPFSGIFEATSSNLIEMSNYINKPFVVEKIFIEMSASFRLSTLPGTLDDALDYAGNNFYAGSNVATSYVVNNLFLLNQRKSPNPRNIDLAILVATASGPTQQQLNYSASNTSRDLISWFDIASYNEEAKFLSQYTTNPEYFARDVTIQLPGATSTTSSWSQKLIMSGAIKSPRRTRMQEAFNVDLSPVAERDSVQVSFFRRNPSPTYIPAGWWGSGGLRGVYNSARHLLNPNDSYSGPTEDTGYDVVFQTGTSSSQWSKDNPYILLPSDGLILGWQLPTHDDLAGALNSNQRFPTGSFVEFPISPAKIVLYGSYLAEEKAVNDTLTQALSSNSIHEAIE